VVGQAVYAATSGTSLVYSGSSMFISSISGNVLTLGNAISFVNNSVTIQTAPANAPAYTAGSYTSPTSGLNTITVSTADAGHMFVGQPIMGACLGSNTTITGVNTSTGVITISGTTIAATGVVSVGAVNNTFLTNQTVNGLTVNPGASSIILNGNGGDGTSLSLGAITRSVGGTVDLTLPATQAGAQTATNGITTTSLAGITNNIVTSGNTAFATVGKTDWANLGTAVSGSANLIKIASYDGNSFVSTANADVTGAQSMSGGTVNTLRFNDPTGGLSLTGVNTITTGGILVTSAVGSGGVNITGGQLTAGAGNEVVVIDYGKLGIGSAIANNPSAVALTVSGTGNTTLSGANTYSGPTNVNSGTVIAGSTQALGVNSAVTLANQPGAAINLSGNNNSVGSLTGGGNNGGNIALGGATLTTGGDNTSTVYAGAITGSGNLTKSGAGTQTLTGASTYSGVTNLTAGTINVGVAEGTGTGPLGNGGSIVFGGGTLQYSAANQNDYSGRFSTAASQQYNIDTNGQTVALASNLTSSGGQLSKIGTGTLTVSGINTYSGPTNVGAGTLQAGAAAGGHAFGTNSAVTVVSGATLALNGYNQSIGSLTGAGQVSLGSNTLTVGGAGSTTYSGAIGGVNGNLTKIGSDTLELTHANTFSGLTTVSVGTLKASAVGALASSINVSQGASLLLNASGAANGDSLTLAGGTLNTEGLNQSLGALSLTATLSARSIIDFTSGHLADTLTFSSGSRTSGASVLIENWDIAGSTHLVFTSNANLDSSFLSSVQFQIPGYQSSGADITQISGGYTITPHNLTPVPEPSTILGALALLGFVGWRERRRIQAILKGQLTTEAA